MMYCREDYILIYALRNGSVPRYFRPRRRFCGTNRELLLARLGGMRVRFISDDQHSNRGFVANFFISRQFHFAEFRQTAAILLVSGS